MEIPLVVADELHEDLAMEVDCELRTSYSGRGMYGKTCLGFVTNNVPGLAFHLGMLLAEWQPRSDEWGEVDTEQLIIAFTGNAHTDSMGLDTIVYWPSVVVVP